MVKMITLDAGNDKLILEQTENDWCPIYLETTTMKVLLGKETWKNIILRFQDGLKVSDTLGGAGCLMMVSEPHGGAYMHHEQDGYRVLFQGKDAPRVFYSMDVSKKQKKQWFDIIAREAKLLLSSK